MAASTLEKILVRLLEPDNAVILQATNEIRQVIKDPAIIPELCSVLSTSPNAQVRQYAAVLLRRKIYRLRHWTNIHDEIRNGLKHGILQVLHTEPEKTVRNAVAQLIASVAKHELPNRRWPELLQMLSQYIVSANITEKEIGHFMLNMISSEAGEQLKPHILWLLGYFSNSLQDMTSQLVPFYTIKTMTNLVAYIGTDEMNKFQPLIPAVMIAIKKLIPVNEDHAREALEIFDQLMESEIGIIVPHIKPLVEFCLEITASQGLDNSTRVMAMSILCSVLRLKKKSVLKHKLINPLLDILFPIMCIPLLDDTDGNDEEEDDDDTNPASFAPQVINVMALHLPPENFIRALHGMGQSKVTFITERIYGQRSCEVISGNLGHRLKMRHLEPALSSNNPYPKKAAYMILGVIAEGCSEHIRKKHLEKYFQVICRGIVDSHHAVRNAALYALGQFSEFLQPEISVFANDIMPLLFQYLSEICQTQQQTNKTSPILTRTFYALETFCENLEDGKLLPFLPILMERLVLILSISNSVETKELAISAIGAAANAAKEAMVPYFSKIIEFLTPYIKEQETEHNISLQVQSIDTLGVLARTIGTETFLPMADDCVRLGLELLDKIDDPDLRRSVYGLFASISTVVKESMSKYFPVMIKHMTDSLLSTEGVETTYSEDHDAFLLFDDADDEEVDLENGSGDEEEGVESYSVSNAYVDEKEDTCCALREIATNAGPTFIPYFEECFDVVKKLTEHPSEEIRRSSITTLGQFCLTLHKSIQQPETLQKVLSVLIPKLMSTIREDTERTVVLAALEILNDMLQQMKQDMLNDSVIEGLVMLIGEAFKHKLACQDESDSEGEDSEEAEYDQMLLGYSGDLIPSLARAVPHPNIMPYIDALLPFLINKTTSRSTVADRSFSIGTLADIVDGLGKNIVNSFVEKTLPIFMAGAKDEDDEVRSNSFYGLGVLVQNSGSVLTQHYPILLQALFAALVKEKAGRTKDNICAAVARMILAEAGAVPLTEVLPVFLSCLPLHEDFDENSTVYQCIVELYGRKNEELIKNLPNVIRIVALVIESKDLDDEIRLQLIALVKSVYQEFPNDFTAVVQSLNSEGQQALSKALGS